MIYAKAFFDLQFRVAETISALGGVPLEQAVFEYTNFYIRFGLGRNFEQGHPIWRDYLEGLSGAPDGREWTYRFYLTRPPELALPAVVATFGCFSYGRTSGDRIRLHFGNAETDGRSPLGIERAGTRRAELAALFEHVRRQEPRPLRVIGASWLYNLEAYRRLFPKSYLETARALHGRYRHMPLWGQFLDRHGELKPDMARVLLERLSRLSRGEDLAQCFPLQVLGLEAPAPVFYEHHGL